MAVYVNRSWVWEWGLFAPTGFNHFTFFLLCFTTSIKKMLFRSGLMSIIDVHKHIQLSQLKWKIPGHFWLQAILALIHSLKSHPKQGLKSKSKKDFILLLEFLWIVSKSVPHSKFKKGQSLKSWKLLYNLLNLMLF